MTRILVQGMHGLGDNLHQRAIVRQIAERCDEVWLETSWSSLYEDLPKVRPIFKRTALRTQTKNAQREATRFTESARLPPFNQTVRVWYPPVEVRRHGSVLAAMCHVTGTDYARADFSLQVPNHWREQAEAVLGPRPDKPLLVYRPLVDRTEWSGCRNRNPEAIAYNELFRFIRDRFYVVSIADLIPGKEWMVGCIAANPDFTAHAGEFHFEALAGLFSLASMVFASPGFAVPLAQAVGTPVVAVFGGYEDASSFAGGARHAPYHPIQPIRPCQCFSHTHQCVKAIDVDAAIEPLRKFADVATKDFAGFLWQFGCGYARAAAALHESG